MLAAAYITTANVWVFGLIIFGLYLVFTGFWLTSFGLFGEFVRQCSTKYERPVRTTLLGLLLGALIVAPGLGLVGALPGAPLKLLAGLVASVPVIIGLAGSAGLAARIGDGLASPVDEPQPWRRVFRGGTVLWFTFLLPFIGWIVLWPLVIASGFGAALSTWFTRRRARRAAEEAPPPVASREENVILPAVTGTEGTAREADPSPNSTP